MKTANTYRMGAQGMVRTAKADVKAGHGYWMGASSSPSFVLVLSADESQVVFCNSYTLDRQVIARWVFNDLVTTAGETVRRAAAAAKAAAASATDATAAGRLAIMMADHHAERAQDHGAKVDFSNYTRVEARIAAPAGVDVYGIAKAWGTLTDWDQEANEATIACSDYDLCRMIGARPVKVLQCRTVKACPAA